jgi:hypothetical protein
MTEPRPNEVFERTMKMLKPALERVVSDPEFRNRLERNPLAALAELHVELDPETRRELEGKRFSEFWAQRRKAAEGPVGVRDLPPEQGLKTDRELDSVSGGIHPPTGTPPELGRTWLDPRTRFSLGSYAPPYVPVGPVTKDE